MSETIKRILDLLNTLDNSVHNIVDLSDSRNSIEFPALSVYLSGCTVYVDRIQKLAIKAMQEHEKLHEINIGLAADCAGRTKSKINHELEKKIEVLKKDNKELRAKTEAYLKLKKEREEIEEADKQFVVNVLRSSSHAFTAEEISMSHYYSISEDRVLGAIDSLRREGIVEHVGQGWMLSKWSVGLSDSRQSAAAEE